MRPFMTVITVLFVAQSKKEMGKVIGALKKRSEAPLIDFGAASKLVQAKLP